MFLSGVFLSSGLDSTALVALASRVQSDLHTFTVVFPEQRFSEAKISRETAKRFKTQSSGSACSLRTVAGATRRRRGRAGPAHHGRAEYLFCVPRRASERSESGALRIGQRRNFWRYSTFAIDPASGVVAGLGRWIPGPLRRLTAAAGRQDCRGRRGRKAAATWSSPNGFSARLLFHATAVHAFAREAPACSVFRIRRRMRKVDVRPGASACGKPRGRRRASIRSLRFPVSSCSPTWLNTLLRDTDAVSMANSLEVRVPFLDHRLVEFVARLPKDAKYTAGSAEIVAGRSLGRFAAGRSCRPSQAHIHSAVGSVAQRPTGRASVAGSGESDAAAAAIHEPARRARRVAEFRHRPDQLVAPLELLRAQRMGAAPRDRAR